MLCSSVSFLTVVPYYETQFHFLHPYYNMPAVNVKHDFHVFPKKSTNFRKKSINFLYFVHPSAFAAHSGALPGKKGAVTDRSAQQPLHFAVIPLSGRMTLCVP